MKRGGVAQNECSGEGGIVAQQVCNGATLQCSFGMAPSSLIVLPIHRVNTGVPDGNIMDSAPLTNIPSFGMCMSIANPAVAAATSAALGVFTPAPCIPNTVGPWTPGAPTVTIDGQPALDNQSTLMCMWGGVISVVSPGQVTVNVP